MKIKKLSESTDKFKNNANIRKPNGFEKDVHMDPVYGDAIESDSKAQENVENVDKELNKKVDGITPKDPGTGKPLRKTIYTEKKTLDENLFEDVLNELTDDELDAERKKLRDAGHGWSNGEFHKGTPEQEKRELELSCIDMINSILAYGGHGKTAEDVLKQDERSYGHYLRKYVNKLGRQRVLQLIQGQIDDIETIERDVATDSEGVHYNSIRWKRKNESKKTDKKSKKIDESLLLIADLSDYTPWSGAVDTWEKIERAGAIDKLDSFLEDMYPEGLTMGELNDLLWFEAEFVLSNLGINDISDEEE